MKGIRLSRVAHDEPNCEAVGQAAVGVEAGDTGDEQQVADAGGEGERWGIDACGWKEVLDGLGEPLS